MKEIYKFNPKSHIGCYKDIIMKIEILERIFCSISIFLKELHYLAKFVGQFSNIEICCNLKYLKLFNNLPLSSEWINNLKHSRPITILGKEADSSCDTMVNKWKWNVGSCSRTQRVKCTPITGGSDRISQQWNHPRQVPCSRHLCTRGHTRVNMGARIRL